MRGVKPTAAIACAVIANACSTGSDGGRASAPATPSDGSSVKNEVYLSEFLPDGSLNFKPGEGVIGGTSYPHSFVASCENYLAVGQAGQQGQPGMEFTVPDGFNRLEFVVGLADSSTETDRSAYVGVWATTVDDQTKLFESSNVTVGYHHTGVGIGYAGQRRPDRRRGA